MTETIDGPRRAPASGGRAKQLVVLLHGYRADGDDLIGLADYWATALPDAAFVSPHAPSPCGESPFGREWFPLVRRDTASVAAGIATATPTLDAFLDRELANAGLPSTALALVGFSQGAMLALDVGPARAEPIAAIVAYSGLIARPIRVAHEGRPPVFLHHGSEDMVVPASALDLAKSMLAAAGIPAEAHLRRGLGHGIDEQGLALGAKFLRRAFGLSPTT